MAGSGGVRGLFASAVGWVIVAIVAFLLFGFVIGTIRFLFRIAILVAVLGGLLWLYLRLRGDPDG
ncbi:MAG: hypothetical protein AAF945_18970 [Actinomycetota bacterium]